MSQLQTEANRLNAQLSSGPRTDAGKATSSKNALKSGLYAQSMIIPGERIEEFEALQAEYHHRYQPAAPEERVCVDLVTRHEWFLRRYSNIECQLLMFGIHALPERGGFELGYVFYDQSQQLARLQRMVTATQRSLFAAIRELERLQKCRRAALQAAENKTTKPGNGFVSSTSPEALPKTSESPAVTPVTPGKSVPAAPPIAPKAA